MGNVNNPHGLRPLGISASGGPQSIEEFQKAAANATAIYQWDPVARQSGNYIGADAITPGTTLISGVVLDYGAASTLTAHKVIVSADAMFEAQSDGTGLLLAAMGLNANLVLDNTSRLNPTTHISGAMISTASAAVTSTLDVHLLKMFDNGVNLAAGGQYSRVEVLINKQRMAQGVAGV